MSVEEIVVDAPKTSRVARTHYRNGENSNYDSSNTPFQNEALTHIDALYRFAMYLTII